jgi:hypothetical protein
MRGALRKLRAAGHGAQSRGVGATSVVKSVSGG